MNWLVAGANYYEIIMKLLFVAGAARSGTTAFADYLNRHQEILVCRERYKYVPGQIDPSFFTFDRLLDYEPQQRSGETNVPLEYHAELLASKDPAKLKWIGDKHPGYVRSLPTIARNNPGASFVLTHRPIEEVVESFEARSKDPEDGWLGGKDGFEMGIEYWNRAMSSTREFAESNPNVLIVGYHDFFYRNEECIPLISRFLDLEFDEQVREAWRETSRKFESERRQKEPLDGEQAALLEERKDHASEEWVLGRIEEQWRELNAPADAGNETERAKTRITVDRNLEEQVRKLEKDLAEERNMSNLLKKRNQKLGRQTKKLEGQITAMQSSKSWRLMGKVGRIRAGILGKKG